MHCFGHSVYKCNLLNDHRHYYCATCESLPRKFLDCLHLVVYRDEILTNGIQFFHLLGVNKPLYLLCPYMEIEIF